MKKNLIISIIIIIITFIFFYYFFSYSKQENFINPNDYYFLSKEETIIFINADEDNYIKNLSIYDLKARKVKTTNEYLDLISHSCMDFTQEQKEKLMKSASQASSYFNNGFKWKFALISSNYEEGFPHTRTDIIFLSPKVLNYDKNDLLDTILLVAKVKSTIKSSDEQKLVMNTLIIYNQISNTEFKLTDMGLKDNKPLKISVFNEEIEMIDNNNNCVKSLLIKKYPKISKNTINNIGNDEGVTTNEIKIFCQKYNIKMTALDINCNIISQFIPEKINKSYSSLTFIAYNNHIYELSNDYLSKTKKINIETYEYIKDTKSKLIELESKNIKTYIINWRHTYTDIILNDEFGKERILKLNYLNAEYNDLETLLNEKNPELTNEGVFRNFNVLISDLHPSLLGHRIISDNIIKKLCSE